jgi:hypothetical protein
MGEGGRTDADAPLGDQVGRPPVQLDGAFCGQAPLRSLKKGRIVIGEKHRRSVTL